MMSVFNQVLSALSQLFKWWFTIEPWEQGIRVRLGKRIREFEAGVHFRIPFFDQVYVQNIRKRMSPTSPQTLSTVDRKTISICGSLSYRIDNILTLYKTLHQAEETLRQQVEGILSDYVVENSLENCRPDKICEHVRNRIDFSEYGLVDVEFFLTDFAIVRTYRLINGDLNRWVDHQLDTVRPQGQHNQFIHLQ